ncbi:endonuclease/exonuclease/phosphatase family protein [Fulvivirga ulvae]|uniref:endonuclease/exonuclease/phosphatase family protein n=1 Tax=Fulvivirga ulvae TaxID=2904245 RepID=UPI001F18DBA5|nr:endonuclease/exonuclease/phosphatase family protein [Fulvivirga ulvae]UII30838.1 endonuclease/exonuclease/phosphatase family protein [Fulvivirga ulvae]
MRYILLLIVAIISTWCSNRQLPATSDNDPACTSISDQLSSCIALPSSETLEIMTWNIENFPKDSTTFCLVSNIIKTSTADVIAVQEIDSPEDFSRLATQIEGWKGVYHDVRGGIETGFLYKTSEIVSVGTLKSIFPDNRYEFPREPILLTVEHKNGLEVTLVNIHLKCCKDGKERRSKASIMLKQYLDDSLSTQNIVVLGDFNDDISDDTPFLNFVADANHYTFADKEIALQSEEHWSYPSWPAHIDHILISNELTDNRIFTKTVALNRCISVYEDHISDHRPVIISLKADKVPDL